MPRGNGTGPMGEGAMTGRGLGRCSGTFNAGAARGAGRGFAGRGGGCGLGRGGGAGHAAGSLNDLQARVAELETQNK